MNADPYSITIHNAFQGAALPFSVTFWDTPPDPTQVLKSVIFAVIAKNVKH
jgi:hypothetical protein